MSDIKPFVPSDVDLTDFPSMFVDVQRLLKSDTWLAAIDNKVIAWASINLWFESWHQKPAASLPLNDRLLARIAQCELDEFLSVKDTVLTGWTLCQDGRYYHKTVAEKALEAWISKLEQRKKGAAAIAKRWEKPFDPAEFDQRIFEAKNMLALLAPDSKGLVKRGPFKNKQNTTSNTTSNTAGNTTSNTTSIKSDESGKKDTTSITSGNTTSNTTSNTPSILEREGQVEGQGQGEFKTISSETSSELVVGKENQESSIGGESPSGSLKPALELTAQNGLALDDAVEPFILLPQLDGDEYPVFNPKLEEWVSLYLAIDVKQQLRNMRGWLISHPKNRKTKSGMEKFITGWLAKQQDSAGPVKGTVNGSGPARGSKMTEGKHSGFEEKNYSKGIDEHGRF